MKKIVAILGTNANKSTNRLLLENIIEVCEGKAEIELIEISDFPYKDTDKVTYEIEGVIENIKNSDGIIIASVEYLHSPSAALINFLDWMTLPPNPIKNKPLLLCSANHGRVGSVKALSILKQILEDENLSPIIFPKNFILNEALSKFDKKGRLVDQVSLNALIKTSENFLKFLDLFPFINYG